MGHFPSLATPDWADYTENAVGENHPSLADTINRAPKTIQDNLDLVNAAVCPVGAVVDFPYEAPPAGWLECDGSAISRTTYADLFEHLGTRWGKGDGATTFNLPSLRGRFRRGWDHGAGIDPDASSRTSPFTPWADATCDTTSGSAVVAMDSSANVVAGMAVSGSGIPASTTVLSVDSATQITLSNNATATATDVTLTFTLTGDHVGSEQADAFKAHTHNRTVNVGGSVTTATSIYGASGGVSSPVSSTGGSETRPVNAYLMPCIKY